MIDVNGMINLKDGKGLKYYFEMKMFKVNQYEWNEQLLRFLKNIYHFFVYIQKRCREDMDMQHEPRKGLRIRVC